MQEFYRDKSIFLTGATGFLGKVTLEKILRCFEIKSIFILVRNKKGKEMQTRVDEIFEDSFFDRLKEEKPYFMEKVTGISGDCSLPELGISDDDRILLLEEVNVVLHLAANVRFDEKLKIALKINVGGVREIVKLSSKMQNLIALIYVSTAFSNCNRFVIEEKFYPSPITTEEIFRFMEVLDDKKFDQISGEVMKDWPNTYTFTKSLSENFIKLNHQGLPVAIFRPAIVTSTYNEDPIRCWINNFFGPFGMIAGMAAGVLRIGLIDGENTFHIVPVDFCVNALLAVAWDIGKANNAYKIPPIYNFTQNSTNLINYTDAFARFFKYQPDIPYTRAIWYPTFKITTSHFKYNLLKFLYHIVPAFFMDLIRFAIRKKPIMMKTYEKLHKHVDCLAYFNLNTISFSTKNTTNLWHKLPKDEQQKFDFNMDHIDWEYYIKEGLLGIRTHLMKDPPNTIPAAKKKMLKLKYVHYAVVYGLMSLCLYVFYKIFMGIIS